MGPGVIDPQWRGDLPRHLLARRAAAGGDLVLSTQVGLLTCVRADLPPPPEITGELLRHIATHEIGHALGPGHNFRGTRLTRLRNRAAANGPRSGVMASIMDTTHGSITLPSPATTLTCRPSSDPTITLRSNGDTGRPPRLRSSTAREPNS